VTRAAWPAAALVAMIIWSCDSSASGQLGPVIATFDGSKKLELFAGYSRTAASIAITVWADLPAGSEGTIEMTGIPFHIRCQGLFQFPEPGFQAPDHLSYLDVGAGHAGAFFGAPPGRYTAVGRIPSYGATVETSFDAGQSFPDGQTGVFNLPLGCVPVADTKQQLGALLPKYVSAVGILVGKLPASSANSQLSDATDEARTAVVAGDTAAALDALARIRDIVQPLKAQNPYYELLINTQAAIALLTQPSPTS